MKKCSKCLEYKIDEHFRKRSALKDGLSSWCKQCIYKHEQSLNFEKSDIIVKCRKCKENKSSDKFPSNRRKKIGLSDLCLECQKRYRIKSVYGISIEEYNSKLDKQDYKCAICGKYKDLNRFKQLAIDHDHNNGNIRGLLCDQCNSGLGSFKDNIDLLNKAIEYLESYNKGKNELSTY